MEHLSAGLGMVLQFYPSPLYHIIGIRKLRIVRWGDAKRD